MWGPRTLGGKKLKQEQVKRVLRESPVPLLRSLRHNRRISLAFREVLLPGSMPDTWTAGTVCVCVSICFFSHTAFSAQYDSVLAICCHFLISSTRIVWTSEAGLSGVFLPFCVERHIFVQRFWQVLHVKIESIGNVKQFFPFGGSCYDPEQYYPLLPQSFNHTFLLSWKCSCYIAFTATVF